ncbi:rhomboid family protein [Striga asiatica]|uniref:Rhomboid family protein n=1 Tax=Striga asiatica TaxID=4170 RepID=A0A5A7R9V6_STRAF|nr:rhomboid family protein [Striga asiatica]
MERGRGRGGMVGLLLVQALSEYYRLERRPPVTAGLIAANTLIYLRPKFLDPILPTLNQVWFNPHLILKHKDLKRFLLSAFYHIGEPHLVYNMLSLLWKGIQLESAMGSLEYASMVAALVGMSQGTTLLLAKGLLLFDHKKAYYNEYSVGFSGVLFAMKVVLYSQSDDYTYVQGLVVPARYAAWAELILVQMLVPGVSFLGHLGGVLAGLLYVYLKASYSGANPIMKIVRCLLGWPPRFVRWILGASVGRSSESGNGVWRCRVCTYDNGGWFSACEICGTSRDGGGLSSSDDDTETISLEELRERRIWRFRR